MQVNNYSYNPSFQVKLSTVSVLETTSMKIMEDNGLSGVRDVIMSLNKTPFRATGSKGYAYYAKKIGEAIVDKYPQIACATQHIKQILEENPSISRQELRTRVESIVKNLGDVVDITI